MFSGDEAPIHGSGHAAPQQGGASVGPGAHPLDKLLERAATHPADAPALHGRLRELFRANRLIAREASVDAVLTRIVEVARRVAQAEFAALGVLDDDGRLERFIHAGMDDATAAAIGNLPRGRGLLGALQGHPGPLRLADLGADPRSVGFPPHHPAMVSFLGVRIADEGQVHGHLYLTNSLNGQFNAEDEQVVSALAAAAGVTLANASRLDESRLREGWLEASIEISRMLLGSSSDEDVLDSVAQAARRLAAADVVLVLRRTDDPTVLRVAVAAGEGAGCYADVEVPADESIASETLTSGRSRLLDEATIPADGVAGGLRMGPVMTVPLRGEQPPRAAIILGRVHGRPRFSASVLSMAEAFAAQAAVALELFEVRAARNRLSIVEVREALGRDLHDHVIQRLYAVGLRLQAARRRETSPAAVQSQQEAITEIDSVIRTIRTTIFDLSSGDPSGLHPPG